MGVGQFGRVCVGSAVCVGPVWVINNHQGKRIELGFSVAALKASGTCLAHILLGLCTHVPGLILPETSLLSLLSLLPPTPLPTLSLSLSLSRCVTFGA